MKNLLYVKSGPYKVNIDGYNVQAIGLCKQLIKLGYNCDIMFKDDYDHDEELFIDEKTGCKLRILYRKGIKIWDTGIYRSILKKSFLKNYDVVISTEFDQIMTPLLARKHNNVVLYSGPYSNTFKKNFLGKIYNGLFRNTINKRIKHKLVKSSLAKEYMESLGYEGMEVVGVGLNNEKFDEEVEMSSKTKEIVEYMKEKKTILFVGTIDRNKNIDFLMKVFGLVLKQYGDINFLIIGKGDEEYLERCKNNTSAELSEHVRHYSGVDNAEMKYIFPNAEMLVLPSKSEIFGMVMLEAMYLGCPVVTSYNGGSSTLIPNDNYGVALKEFDSIVWCEKIIKILNDEKYKNSIIENARNNINDNYIWERKAKQIIDIIGE